MSEQLAEDKSSFDTQTLQNQLQLVEDQIKETQKLYKTATNTKNDNNRSNNTNIICDEERVVTVNFDPKTVDNTITDKNISKESNYQTAQQSEAKDGDKLIIPIGSSSSTSRPSLKPQKKMSWKSPDPKMSEFLRTNSIELGIGLSSRTASNRSLAGSSSFYSSPRKKSTNNFFNLKSIRDDGSDGDSDSEGNAEDYEIISSPTNYNRLGIPGIDHAYSEEQLEKLRNLKKILAEKQQQAAQERRNNKLVVQTRPSTDSKILNPEFRSGSFYFNSSAARNNSNYGSTEVKNKTSAIIKEPTTDSKVKLKRTRNSPIKTPTITRINLSIFKSPGKHQSSDNKNVYNQETFSWSPTKLTNKYNQRFQTTTDLRYNEKMFKRLQYY